MADLGFENVEEARSAFAEFKKLKDGASEEDRKTAEDLSKETQKRIDAESRASKSERELAATLRLLEAGVPQKKVRAAMRSLEIDTSDGASLEDALSSAVEALKDEVPEFFGSSGSEGEDDQSSGEQDNQGENGSPPPKGEDGSSGPPRGGTGGSSSPDKRAMDRLKDRHGKKLANQNTD
jgi:hypothetical protein